MGCRKCARRRRGPGAALRVALLAAPALFWAAVFATLAGARPAAVLPEEAVVYSNVNLGSAAGALTLAGTFLVLAALGLLLAHAPAKGRGRRARAAAGAADVPLGRPPRPGESYTTDPDFDLPEGSRPNSLLVNEGDFVTRLVGGRQNSPPHGKAKFAIPPQA